MARKARNLDGQGRPPERPDYGPQTWTAPPAELKPKLKAYLGRERDDVRMKPNLAYMNALLDAVEAGRRFGNRYPSEVEILAAARATGREIRMREPGEEG